MTAHDQAEQPNVLFVDNYDSFTYNLVEYISQMADTTVVKNTASISEIEATDPDGIVISPGPGHPKERRSVGVSRDVFRELSPETPTLGVCLGLETAVYEYGGEVGRAPEAVHGMASPITHDGTGLFAGIDQQFEAGRYHSLVAESVPDCFQVSAVSDENELVMGIRHTDYPIACVQFHPESVLTGVGHRITNNFIEQLIA